MRFRAGWLALLLALPGTGIANNTLIAPGTTVSVAKSTLTVTPDREWNRMGARQGPNTERWTIDGVQLNELAFFGGIAAGTSLLGKIGKSDRPLPLFNATMLITDIPAMFENTYRVGADIAVMSIGQIEPMRFAGYQGVRFAYDFTHPDEVRRKGEAYATIANGRLYLITFEAPALHFFDAGIASARAVAASASFAAKN